LNGNNSYYEVVSKSNSDYYQAEYPLIET